MSLPVPAPVTPAATHPGIFFAPLIVSCIVIVALFWLFAAKLGMGFLPEEYAMWSARHDLIAACKIPATVIQGDSRAAAGMLPAEIGNAANFGFGGATPVELYFIAQDILHCPNAPRQVVVSVSPTLFTGTPWFWDRSALFGLMNFTQYEDILARSRALHDTAIYGPPKLGDLDAKLDNWLHAEKFPAYYTTYILTHAVVGRLHTNKIAYAQALAADGQHFYGMADGSNEIAEDAALQNFQPSPLFNEFFERMLADYGARGVKVYFIAVPMNQSTYDKMNPQVVAQFQTYIDGLAKTHKNFQVVGRTITPLDDKYFGDSTHLNPQGAKYVSVRINQFLHSAMAGSVPQQPDIFAGGSKPAGF